MDGEAGTTGLQIRQRLLNHPLIDILSINPALRKSPEARRALMEQADVTVLCLPDEAAREAALMIADKGSRVRLLDASSAHRVSPGWVYGLAEVAQNQREKIAKAERVSNPGCYPTGVILLLKPLISHGLLAADSLININAVSGYSGGGKALIEQYETTDKLTDKAASAYALYGLNFQHKHIPEMMHWSGLQHSPNFFPAVVPLLQGMVIQIPLHRRDIKASASELNEQLQAYYHNQPAVEVLNPQDIRADTFFKVESTLLGQNRCQIGAISAEDDERYLLLARLDNLGKGASGAAVQNLNIMLGFEEGLCTDLHNVKVNVKA